MVSKGNLQRFRKYKVIDGDPKALTHGLLCGFLRFCEKKKLNEFQILFRSRH